MGWKAIVGVYFLIKLCWTEVTSDCLNCEEFNRLNSMECAMDLTQCGECIPGFIPDETEPRICFALEIVSTLPKSIGGTEGQSLELVCEFNSVVECAWERNGQHVDVDDSPRYAYRRELTEDCTLVIEDLNPLDAGEWQCGSRATSSTISVKSAIVTVNVHKKDREETQTTPSGHAQTTSTPTTAHPCWPINGSTDLSADKTEVESAREKYKAALMRLTTLTAVAIGLTMALTLLFLTIASGLLYLCFEHRRGLFIGHRMPSQVQQP